jgi:hypothetical protein
MRRLGYAIALLALLVCPATADTATPGLVQENLLLPITLPNGSQVKLEAMVIRPDRPGRLPLVVLGTARLVPVVRPFVPRWLTNRRPSSSVRQWHLRGVVMRRCRSCAVALVPLWEYEARNRGKFPGVGGVTDSKM